MRFYELLESNGHYLDPDGVEVYAISNSFISDVEFGIIKSKGSSRHLFHKEKKNKEGFLVSGKDARNYIYFLTEYDAITFNNEKILKVIRELNNRLDVATVSAVIENLNRSIENAKGKLK